MKKIAASALSILLGSALLVGCGTQSAAPQSSAAAQKVTLTFWHGYTPDKQAVLKEYIQKYESSHPNVLIQEQFVANGDAMLKKIQSGLVSGQLPDISWGFPTWTGVLASSGKIQDIDGLLDDQMKKDIFPGVLEAGKFQGKTYSLPIEAGSLILIYNKKLTTAAGIQSAPKTWDELLADAQKLTKGDQFGLYIPNQSDERTTWTWESFLWQNGGKLVEGDKPAFNTAAGKEATTFYTDLITKYKVAPKDKIDVDSSFQNGKVAMVISTQGAADTYVSKFQMDIGVAPLPAKVKQSTGLGSNSLFLFKSDDAKQKAAWEFMKWLTNTENNADWAVKTGYLPVRASSVDSKAYQDYGVKNPAHLVAAQSLQFGQIRPNNEYYPKLSNAISDAIQKVIFGQANVDTALNEAESKAAAVMK